MKHKTVLIYSSFMYNKYIDKGLSVSVPPEDGY